MILKHLGEVLEGEKRLLDEELRWKTRNERRQTSGRKSKAVLNDHMLFTETQLSYIVKACSFVPNICKRKVNEELLHIILVT